MDDNKTLKKNTIGFNLEHLKMLVGLKKIDRSSLGSVNESLGPANMEISSHDAWNIWSFTDTNPQHHIKITLGSVIDAIGGNEAGGLRQEDCSQYLCAINSPGQKLKWVDSFDRTWIAMLLAGPAVDDFQIERGDVLFHYKGTPLRGACTYGDNYLSEGMFGGVGSVAEISLKGDQKVALEFARELGKGLVKWAREGYPTSENLSLSLRKMQKVENDSLPQYERARQ
jgi:hypothetical protein